MSTNTNTSANMSTKMIAAYEAPKTKGRLLAYLRWQLLDFVLERGILILLIGVGIGFPLVRTVRLMTFGGAVNMVDSPLIAGSIASLLMTIAPVLTFLAFNGIVSGDRSNGNYKFLFTKPISMQMFYAQRFLVHGIGLIVGVAALILIGRFALLPLKVLPTLGVFAVSYVSLAGIGFLFSTFMKHDSIAIITIWIASTIGYQVYADRGGIIAMALNLLPPFHIADSVYRGFFGVEVFALGNFLWLVGYGAVCFVLGLIVLRYRELGS